jgi:hypothetical protein
MNEINASLFIAAFMRVFVIDSKKSRTPCVNSRSPSQSVVSRSKRCSRASNNPFPTSDGS